ncbi:MAG: hypothetical protein K6A38_05555 [Lachnospiraceae bacterium]|nr:hypothetical protein [Lachnospiraceae bacterium]
MDKKYKAYLSLEGSFLFPMIVLVYYLIISASLLLLNRCLTAQNNYVIGMRAASFSMSAEKYGEVIYYDISGFDRSGYALDRLYRIKDSYPSFPVERNECDSYGQDVFIRTYAGSIIGRNDNMTECHGIDPVSKIRGLRN